MQPSPVIRIGYNNQMLRSLRALPQTEGAHPASVDTLLTRIVVFIGELNQELRKLTAQQVIDLIRSNPEIMPPEWAQDLAKTETRNQTDSGQQQPQYPFQYSGQLIQYPIQPVQFPVIKPLNPFLPTVNPPQTPISQPRLLSNETIRDQQVLIQPSQLMEQTAKQTVERPRQSRSGFRGVCCCGYAGIGGINILYKLLLDVVLCLGLSTVYFA
ncbi:MAG: hypothetical protein EZS28_046483, partial [Streblomastix strix]